MVWNPRHSLDLLEMRASIYGRNMFRPLLTLATLVTLGASGCQSGGATDVRGMYSKTQQIVGGSDVLDGEFEQVILLNTGCTGVLLDEEHFITAAHCIADPPVTNLFRCGDVTLVVNDASTACSPAMEEDGSSGVADTP